jgi:hypothetical protein
MSLTAPFPVFRAATLERLALLQHAAAQAAGVSWRDAYALVKLTPAVNDLIGSGLAAFSSRPSSGVGTISNMQGADFWAVRVTSRGFEELSRRVQALLILSELNLK